MTLIREMKREKSLPLKSRRIKFSHNGEGMMMNEMIVSI